MTCNKLRFFIILVSLRLRSVKNIQKITKSMKMVSAAKFGRAEKELRPARVYGAGASGIYIVVRSKLVLYNCFPLESPISLSVKILIMGIDLRKIQENTGKKYM